MNKCKNDAFFVATLLLLHIFHRSNSAGLFKCPQQPFVKGFNITKFTGQWYEIERTFNIAEVAIKCVSMNISRNKRGQIQVISTNVNKWTGNENLLAGIAVPRRRDPSIYQYKTSSILPNHLRPSIDVYQVLATDYTNYAIIWSCSDYNLFYRDFIWIFGRTREIDVRTRAKLYDFLTTRHIDTERLLISNSNSCMEDSLK